MDDFATGYLAGQDGGNNNGGFFGNEGLWAVIILAIIFGWGTNGYGRNGGDNGMNSYIPYLVGTGATGQGGADPLTLRASTLTWQRRSLRTAMLWTARRISTGIALLISKKEPLCSF